MPACREEERSTGANRASKYPEKEMLGGGTVFVIWCVGGSSESKCSQYTFIHTVYIENVLNMSNMHTTLTGHVQC